MASKTWAEFKTYFAEEHRARQDTHHTPVGKTYPSANALVETNRREGKTIDSINLLELATAINRDTYANLYGTVASMMADLVFDNKNLVEVSKENNRLEQVLGQFQKITRSGSRVAVRGCTPQQKNGAHYCWSCGYYADHPSFK